MLSYIFFDPNLQVIRPEANSQKKKKKKKNT